MRGFGMQKRNVALRKRKINEMPACRTWQQNQKKSGDFPLLWLLCHFWKNNQKCDFKSALNKYKLSQVDVDICIFVASVATKMT